MTEKAAVDQALEFATGVPDHLVQFAIKGYANGDAWKDILVIYNGSEKGREAMAPGNWIIVANGRRAGVEPLQTARDRIPVEPFSLVIAYSANDAQESLPGAASP